jgi:hypothetical protein
MKSGVFVTVSSLFYKKPKCGFYKCGLVLRRQTPAAPPDFEEKSGGV